MEKNKKASRFPEIDILRGLAIIGMIVFHLFFILDFYNIYNQNMYQGFWLILARIVQFTFLILVGVSLAISSKKRKNNFHQHQIYRSLQIFAFSLLITITTYLILPEQYVRFGILHLIAFSIFLLNFSARSPMANLIISATSIILSLYIKNIPTSSLLLTIIGFKNRSFISIDHFPVFPWIALISFGIFIGHKLHPQLGKISQLNKFPLLNQIGKHSLSIYILHIPIIIMILMIFQILPYSLIR